MLLRHRDRVRLAEPFLWSLYAGHRLRSRFDSVQHYCMFVGYPRSGHSLVGALLNAHERIVIAHELDALRYVAGRFSRRQIYALILRRDREFVARGARWTGYDYSVPQSAQGRAEEIRVIGDKKGGRSSLRIASDPNLLTALERLVGPPLRIIHVTRNPFDIIATMFNRGGRTMTDCIQQFERHCLGSARALDFAGPDRAITLALDDLILDPRASIRALCDFLEQDAPVSYLENCASRVFESSRQTRHSVNWLAADVMEITGMIERFPFLGRFRAEIPAVAES